MFNKTQVVNFVCLDYVITWNLFAYFFLVDMVDFLNAAYQSIPTLAGLKFTGNDLEECYGCSKVKNGAFTVFLGCDQVGVIWYTYSSLCV